MTMKPHRRPKAGILATFLGGLSPAQVLVVASAVVGGGGLVGVDAHRGRQDNNERTTATATLAVSALESIDRLEGRVEDLASEVRRLRRNRGPVSHVAVAPDTLVAVHFPSATAPQPAHDATNNRRSQ